MIRYLFGSWPYPDAIVRRFDCRELARHFVQSLATSSNRLAMNAWRIADLACSIVIFIVIALPLNMQCSTGQSSFP